MTDWLHINKIKENIIKNVQICSKTLSFVDLLQNYTPQSLVLSFQQLIFLLKPNLFYHLLSIILVAFDVNFLLN